MHLAESLVSFIADPVGRYRVGRNHIVFCDAADLFGHVSWGRPDVDDVRELLSGASAALGIGPHRYLVDLRGLEWVDPTTFGPFVDYTRRHAATLRTNLVRQAQLRPDGVVGAIISGFSAIASLPYPERVFAEVDQALAWAGIDQTRGLALIAELDAIRRRVSATHPLVARVRELLETHGLLAIDDAAQRLGVSVRTLQRGLTEGSTSYRAEQHAWQMERAKLLLLDESLTLTWVAFELGFSSLQHFTTAFRRATGQPPGLWRKTVTRTTPR